VITKYTVDQNELIDKHLNTKAVQVKTAPRVHCPEKVLPCGYCCCVSYYIKRFKRPSEIVPCPGLRQPSHGPLPSTRHPRLPSTGLLLPGGAGHHPDRPAQEAGGGQPAPADDRSLFSDCELNKSPRAEEPPAPHHGPPEGQLPCEAAGEQHWEHHHHANRRPGSRPG